MLDVICKRCGLKITWEAAGKGADMTGTCSSQQLLPQEVAQPRLRRALPQRAGGPKRSHSGFLSLCRYVVYRLQVQTGDPIAAGREISIAFDRPRATQDGELHEQDASG